MTSQLMKFLMQELRIGERELKTLIATAPYRYKTYYIPKRSGGRREIAQPALELKVAQRIIVANYLNRLPVHHCATAYKLESSIRHNAEMHAPNRVILKYDFIDFFPSITEKSWINYCKNNSVFEPSDAIILGRLLFRRSKKDNVLRLSIGAPSSPVLSNILMNEFDAEVSRRVQEHKITYSRYADDMTFSAERTWNLRQVNDIIKSSIKKTNCPRLVINDKKTTLVTPKYHRQVTGVVLTLDNKVSLGRIRKRNIRSAIYHYTLGKLDLVAQVRLAGTLAFARDIDPDFYLTMKRVYGVEVINNLNHATKAHKRDR